MERRTFLTIAGIASLGALSGCVGSESDAPSPPSSDTDPKELLPDGDDWTLDETTRQDAGLVGAEAGIQGNYTGPADEHYTVEILRWSSEDDADQRTPEVYENGWTAVVTHGVFGFAANGPDGETVRDLLAASSALSESLVSDAE